MNKDELIRRNMARNFKKTSQKYSAESAVNKAQQQQELENDIKNFLANGGTIERLPTGASAYGKDIDYRKLNRAGYNNPKPLERCNAT